MIWFNSFFYIILDSESQSQDVSSNLISKRRSKIRESSSESGESSESSDSSEETSSSESEDSSDDEERMEVDMEESRDEFLNAVDLDQLEKYVSAIFSGNLKRLFKFKIFL